MRCRGRGDGTPERCVRAAGRAERPHGRAGSRSQRRRGCRTDVLRVPLAPNPPRSLPNGAPRACSLLGCGTLPRSRDASVAKRIPVLVPIPFPTPIPILFPFLILLPQLQAAPPSGTRAVGHTASRPLRKPRPSAAPLSRIGWRGRGAPGSPAQARGAPCGPRGACALVPAVVVEGPVKMAAGQGCGGGGNNGTGSGTGTAAGSGAAGLGIPAHLTLSFSSGPHWGAAALPQSHTVRSLERALEEAGSSGILCLSGRKLRDFPSSGCDLSDTTQAGEGALAAPGRGCGRSAGPLRARR